MPLGERQTRLPRKANTLIFPEREIERRPFEGFIERELTEERIQSGVKFIEERHTEGRKWNLLCTASNALALLARERLPAACYDQLTFTALVSRTDPISDYNIDYIRTLKTLFAGQDLEYADELPPKIQRAIALLRNQVDTFRPLDNEDWQDFYYRAFMLTLLQPEARSSLPLTEDTAQKFVKVSQKDKQFPFIPVSQHTIGPRLMLAILQPELKDLFPLDHHIEQAVSDELRANESNPTAIVQILNTLANVAMVTAERVEIPSCGRIILHSAAEPIPPRQPLPIQAEYT